ncbi:MAG: hypothetical protein ACYTHJ_04475 [Planctomycetota bacterium]|jgi:hypothetical protein
MKRRSIKKVVLAGVASGWMFTFGCIPWGEIFWDVALNAATELVWDSDVVFDFFGDDAPGLIL